jgi:hypothetical protein
MGALVAASRSREFSVSQVVTTLVPGAGAATPVVAATPADAASLLRTRRARKGDEGNERDEPLRHRRSAKVNPR